MPLKKGTKAHAFRLIPESCLVMGGGFYDQLLGDRLKRRAGSRNKPCVVIHCTVSTIHSKYEKLPEAQLMRIHKQKGERKNEKREEMEKKRQRSHQRRNIYKNKCFLKGQCDWEQRRELSTRLRAHRNGRQAKRRSVIYGKSGCFGGGRGLYTRRVVKNLANHTLFCDGSVLSSRQWAEITPKCKLSQCLEKCAQNQKRHKNTEAKKALWSVRALRSRSMSPHLAGERALRAACATLVASKRMKEHCNGWKASCMLKRPDWWLAITHLPLFIRLDVLATQTACLRCHKAPWQQRTRYIYLISTVNVSLRERRLIYYLKRL